MARITPRNIIRHELIGLHARVARSSNPCLVGIEGVVIDETKNMLVILHEGRPKMVPKDVCVFVFRLPDGTLVEVDGKVIIGRPEDRVKKPIKGWW